MQSHLGHLFPLSTCLAPPRPRSFLPMCTPGSGTIQALGSLPPLGEDLDWVLCSWLEPWLLGTFVETNQQMEAPLWLWNKMKINLKMFLKLTTHNRINKPFNNNQQVQTMDIFNKKKKKQALCQQTHNHLLDTTQRCVRNRKSNPGRKVGWGERFECGHLKSNHTPQAR